MTAPVELRCANARVGTLTWRVFATLASVVVLRSRQSTSEAEAGRVGATLLRVAKEYSMLRNRRLAMVLASLWIAVAAGFSPTVARAQPPAAQGTTLVKAEIAALPGPPDPGVEFWFFRLSVDAGGSFPSSPNLGVTVLLIETGSVTIEQRGAGEIIHADGTRQSLPTSTNSPQIEHLAAGDALVTGSGSTTGLQNTSAQTATALVAEVFSPIEEVQTVATPISDLPGIRMQLLSVGRGSLPEGPGTLLIERVVVDQSEMAAEKGSLALEVGSVEQGTARLSATADVFIWPGSSSQQPKEDMLFGSAPTERVLQSGDGYALPNGIAGFVHAEGNAPATILRAIVAPAGKP
jgi:hypothetical protein